MSNISISYQFSPVSFDLKKRMREELKGNQYKIMDTVADEIYLFQDTRLTLTKELSCRYLAGKTGIRYDYVARGLRQLQKKNFIVIVKSNTEGEGSLITILKNSTPPVLQNSTTPGLKNSTNQENLSIKKDLQEDDPDSSLKIEQAIEEKPMENSLNSSPDIQSLYTSSKESNSNNFAINSLCPPAVGATGKSEFSSLGSVLTSGVMNSTSSQKNPTPPIGAPVTASPTAGIRPAIVEKGKAILQEKGFTAPQVQAITQRITDSIRKHLPKKPDSYFLTAVKNEKIKTSVTAPPALGNNTTGSPAPSARQIPTGAGAMVQVQKNSFTETVNRWEEEKKKDSPEETIKKLMALMPDELYRVILDVDKSPAGKFISLPEIKASLYIAEFKKRYPDVKV